MKYTLEEIQNAKKYCIKCCDLELASKFYQHEKRIKKKLGIIDKKQPIFWQDLGNGTWITNQSFDLRKLWESLNSDKQSTKAST